jgi:hypothetical protein
VPAADGDGAGAGIEEGAADAVVGVADGIGDTAATDGDGIGEGDVGDVAASRDGGVTGLPKKELIADVILSAC